MGRVVGYLGLACGLLWTGETGAAEPKLETGVEPARVRLLTEHLDRYSTLAAIEPYLPAVTGTLCAAGTVALAAADADEIEAPRAVVLAPTIACTALSFGAYLLPNDYEGHIGSSLMLLTPGSVLAIAAIASTQLSAAQRTSLLALGGAAIGFGALHLVDALLERPVALSTLADHAVVLRAGGTSLSRSEVASFEADYRRLSERPIPRWAYGMTQLVSAMVAASPALSPNVSKRDRTVALLFAGSLLLSATPNLAIALTTPTPYERYRRDLSRVSLSPIGPAAAAGLWAVGSF